jgi:tetratricopeptide (TPR) repeat protein
MEQLKRQVGRAQRWLGLQRFVGVLGWCCSATLLVALVMIVVDKIWPTGVAPWTWATSWAAGAVALGISAAAFWAVFRGSGPIEAAIEIDRRFRLKERVSSALAMSQEERETASGQAVVDDAVRRVRRIDVGEHFTLAPGRQILLPLIPAVLAFLVAWLVSPAAVDQQAQANTDPQVQKQIEQSTKSLRQKLVEQRKRAQEQGLKDAEDLFKRLEEGTDDLAEKAQGERKKALVKLNDLAREIQQRREQLGGAEKIQQQLRQLKNIDQGPADKLLKAVQQGDFKQAREELEKLKEQLAGGDLNDEQRKQLANQLNQMEEKMKKLAEAHRQAEQDLQNRADQARQAGRPDEANELEEQLNKLRQQLPQMEMLQDLANKLGQCAECLNGGQLKEAASTLDGLQADLSSLEQQLQEMQMLDEALGQLGQSRDQMSCSQCGGVGCGACQGQIPGMGLGEGRGIGDRPEEENDVKFYDTQASVKTGPGAASIVGEVEGPNIRGDVQQEMKEQYEATQRRSTDPLVGQQMSREHRRHAQEYFDRFREGE